MYLYRWWTISKTHSHIHKKTCSTTHTNSHQSRHSYLLALVTPFTPTPTTCCLASTQPTHTSHITCATCTTILVRNGILISQIDILDWSLFPFELFLRMNLCVLGSHQVVIYLLVWGSRLVKSMKLWKTSDHSTPLLLKIR